MMVEEILGAAKNIKKADVDTIKYKNEMMKEMIEKGVDRETAKKWLIYTQEWQRLLLELNQHQNLQTKEF